MIPDDAAWHVRGDPVTHWGPVLADVPVLLYNHHGRRLRCGWTMDARYVAGPAPGPKAAECTHCVRGLD